MNLKWEIREHLGPHTQYYENRLHSQKPLPPHSNKVLGWIPGQAGAMDLADLYLSEQTIFYIRFIVPQCGLGGGSGEEGGSGRQRRSRRHTLISGYHNAVTTAVLEPVSQSGDQSRCHVSTIFGPRPPSGCVDSWAAVFIFAGAKFCLILILCELKLMKQSISSGKAIRAHRLSPVLFCSVPG